MMKIKSSKKIVKILFILLFVSFISSCGGGDPTPLPIDTSSSDWDGMVWDQDDWG